MESGFWLTMLFFSGLLVFAFAVILFIINKLSTEVEPGKTWSEAMDEFREKHPVWNFFYTFLPLPFNLLLQLVGPKRPKFPTKDE
jgi:hypothetical protein|tara:strand:- start:47 stop:301 length:255 start_codon:yes stop_codon:yes gene_type:complete